MVTNASAPPGVDDYDDLTVFIADSLRYQRDVGPVDELQVAAAAQVVLASSMVDQGVSQETAMAWFDDHEVTFKLALDDEGTLQITVTRDGEVEGTLQTAVTRDGEVEAFAPSEGTN